MQAIRFILLMLAAALVATGCELITKTDDTSVTITDGAVSSFQTRQGDLLITAPGNSSTNRLR